MKKLIALYLPQYHSFQENDHWWGEGFTEWTCVEQAYPRSIEHRIKKPHPDIGRYSLLSRDVRLRQAQMARAFGVYGFCYYHYWFGDKVLMDAPLKLLLQDGQPDLPFCFSWANEPWTRRMNGGNGELLQPNNYGGPEEWERHLNYLIPFFQHPNYIKVQNKPLLVIYRVSQIPQYEERFAYWRRRLREHGFDDLFIVMTLGNFSDDFSAMAPYVDATFDFYPNFLWQPDMILKVESNVAFYDMERVYRRIAEGTKQHSVHFFGTMVGFDSSPRSPQRCNVFIRGTPALFRESLEMACSKSEHEFVFVNAWNEWGEGCALEPEEEDGYGYLEAVRKVMRRHNAKVC